MIVIKDVIDNIDNIDVSQLAKIFDRLWKAGTLKDIHENVSSELFCLHVGINMVGIWKAEGWDGIIGEHADFVPYISSVLTELSLSDMQEAFENVIKLFPEGTIFKSDDAEYYDICNFLQTLSYKVQNERLKMIVPEKRREMVKLMKKNIEILDDLTQRYWSDKSQCDGWKQIFDYLEDIQINRNF